MSVQREFTPADLRGILKYVPLWRGHTFVIALDGAVFDQEEIQNILLQLAVLQNLHIRICLVFGIGSRMRNLASERGVVLSESNGSEVVDEATLRIAIDASNQIRHQLEKGLSQHRLKAVSSTVVQAVEKGILKGKDTQFAGRVGKLDSRLLQKWMDDDCVPVIPPLAFSKDGKEFRLNSDELASDLAIALKASKLIYLLPFEGLTCNGEFQLNVDASEIRDILERNPASIDEPVRSKARFALKTIQAGTPRAHILDSRIHDGLLMEIFSKVGIGSMIHSNPYSMFRPARKSDAAIIHSITKGAVREASLRPRSRSSIENAIGEYHVYEIDESIIGCFRLTAYPRSRTVEIGSLFVHPAYKGRQIGKTMVDYALQMARKNGKSRMVALTTQAIPFFRDSCGFLEGSMADLPKKLRELVSASPRNSQILVRNLDSPDYSTS